MTAPATCPLCGDGFIQTRSLQTPIDVDSDPFGRALARKGITRAAYGVCRACGSLVAVDDRRSGAAVDHLDYSGLSTEYWAHLHDGARIASLVAGALDSTPRASRPTLIDVGCGAGALIASLPNHYEKRGIEPGRAAVAAARKRGFDVVEGTAASLGLEDVADVVTLVDVLEHLPNPQLELSAIRRMLRPSGTLVVVTGCADAVTARVARENWYYLRCAGHVSVASGRGLGRLLERAGFRVQGSKTVNHPGSKGAIRWGRRLAGNVARRILRRPLAAVPFFFDHQLVVAGVSSD